MRKNKFIALGFNTDLIDKILSKNLTLSALRGTNKAALEIMGFTDAESMFITENVNRKPIPSEIIEELLKESGEICCYCSDGNKIRPYQIHHINDYANSQDHSLTNLMLVCPTHHVHIHSSKASTQEQHAVKKAWINIWHIASEYQAKGQAFPFGGFEYIDYEIQGEVTDIFNFGPAKPSVCEKLNEGPLLQNAVKMLSNDNKILLSGASGSGKTTFSLAIGAKLRKTQVYRYAVGEKGSADTMGEILLFLGIAIKPVLLIIDDANTKLIASHTEKILGFAEGSKKVIVVNTKVELSGNDSLEQRVASSVLPITWGLIQSTVKANLLNNEKEILTFLQEKGLANYHGDKIGYSMTDRRLNYVLDSYASGTDTVWQFIFMLASGTELLNNRVSELYAHGRLDLLVVFLAVNQIATAEQGSSIEEISNFFISHSHYKNQIPPNIEWIKTIINNLNNWRIIKKNRDRINLAHRMLAVNFLELVYLRDRKNTEEILNMFFLSQKPARQLLILWSWLRTTQVRNYTSAWKSSRSLSDWADIADRATSDGLMCLSIMTDILHPGNEGILSHVLIDKGQRLGELINKKEPGALYYFNKLAMAIRYHAPEIWPSLLKEIDKNHLYQLIIDAPSWELDKVKWLLSSIRESGEISWIISLTEQFHKSDFIVMANRLEKGDIRSFSELITFWRVYVMDLSIRDFISYIYYIPKLLKDCKIRDFQFPFHHDGYSEIMVFPDLMGNILNALNPLEMAAEFIELTPDHWGNVLILSGLAKYANHDVITTFLALVDLDKLMENIRVYYLQDLYNFRLMIHQLAYDNERKTEISKHLKPLIEVAVPKSILLAYHEHESILEAFSRIDYEWVESYCVKSNISLDLHRREMEEEDEHEKNAIFHKLDQFSPDELDELLPSYKIRLPD